MSTPISPKTRLFINSAKEEDIITVQDYITQSAKDSKLDEGIVKSFLYGVKSGEEVTTDDLDTPAAKKAGKALIVKLKADMKSHDANKAEYEKLESDLKAAKAAERLAIKEAVIKDKAESAQMFALVLEDDALVTAKNQLTEESISTITGVISNKFQFDENGIISIDPENLPTKQEFATAFGAVTTMVTTGAAVQDSASKMEAQIGFAAKKTLGETWVNLFSASADNLSRVMKGVKVFELVDAFKNKKARALFGKLPFTTSRALLEFKVTTAEIEGTAEKAAEKNLAAKKEVFLQAVAMQNALKESDEHGVITQRDAKKLVTDYKESLGIKAPEKMKYIHIMYIEKKIRVFGQSELKTDNIRLAILSFDSDGNRLSMNDDGKNIIKIPLVGPEADVMKFILDNASPPELTKEEKAAAALREKEAAKAAKAAAKGEKGKKASKNDDEQEDDAPSTKAVVKTKAPEPEEQEEEEDDAEVVEASDDDEDDAPAKKGVTIADDDEE